jgi:hypothetical protein
MKTPLNIKNIDIHVGTFSVSEERVQRNRETLLNFFSEEKHLGVLEGYDSESIVLLMRLYISRRDDTESLFSYCRQYKQAAREISDIDIVETVRMLNVKKVMEG